jgi:hypothetical protein
MNPDAPEMVMFMVVADARQELRLIEPAKSAALAANPRRYNK